MGQFSQGNRLIQISQFSLADDTLLLTDFSGQELVSGLFDFHITCISEDLEINPDDIVGKTCTVTINDKKGRDFNGFITSFVYGEVLGQGASATFREYRMRLSPWLWFLTQTNDHRIFQEKNTKEIVTSIFADLGFSDYEFKAEGGSAREYCIQHNESDFHFISRLLEEEGITYYFKHDSAKHTLVLVDQKNAFDAVTESEAEYSRGTSGDTHISQWQHLHQFRKGQWTLNDYNFKEPTKDLTANTISASKFAKNKNFEHYEYPGVYDFAKGADLAKIRMDSEEAGKNAVQGASNCASFYAGGRFSLGKHESAAEKGDYVLTSVIVQAHDHSYGLHDSTSSSYRNQFTCIPADIHIRPARVHTRPVMRGPQSAVVVGPSGEEIYLDEYNRVKVQFIWDREGKNDENSSCYLRVMQAWAGNQWGASFVPRIGHEVIVDFLDGDPDRPIITGSVYNGKNKPPFNSKTQSGFRTRSSKNGTGSNCNELRFDDKKGAEQIYVHAEMNLDTEVENDETHTVDHNRTKSIGDNEKSSIGKDRSKTVGKNESESIGENKDISVGKNHTESIGEDKKLEVGANHTETIGKNMTISVAKDLKESVDGTYVEKVTKEYGLSAKEITLKADKKITLQTGSAKIVMSSNGDIQISGKNITVKGSGKVVIKGSKTEIN
ncbi:type VI secretion system Vgr family protein [Teredinibacter turnerae]|uniref:type VI secretion system Vgr family protein n=1 Tax=Teredinibacter turnerae TaxID=2426 RepID=UPI0003803E72|nr:type VI secretion system tip protein TssI/VgrG [Teredinibacter turnerae]